MEYSRRKFLEFLGVSGVTLTAMPLLNACKTAQVPYSATVCFDALKLSEVIDDVMLAEGFDYKVLASFGDKNF